MLNIPPHWKTAKLGEACEIILGQSPPSNTYNTIGSGLPFFQGKKEFTNLNPKTEKWCSKPIRVALPNDILLSVRAPVGNTNIADLKCCIGRGLAAIRYKPNYKFAFYYLRSTINQLNELSTGSTFSAISGSDLRNFKFPLPPLPEQHLIVAKIEELFSELDNAVENLKKAKEQLKVYRQAVLKWAFEGKLTEEWRKKRESQNTKYQSEKEEVSMAAEEKVLYKSKKLPFEWTIKKISELFSVVTGSTPSKSKPEFYSSGYPFYKPTDLEQGINTITSLDNLSELGFNNSRKLPEGSILVTCIGATIGKTGMIHRKGSCNQQINAVLPNRSFISKFVYYQFISKNFQDRIKSNASSTTLPILNKTKFENLDFINVPHEEQSQIVEEIETRFSVADKLEQIIDQSLHQAEALRQSILNKAFLKVDWLPQMHSPPRRGRGWVIN
jgi:type I restriction enzyme S subunit